METKWTDDCYAEITEELSLQIMFTSKLYDAIIAEDVALNEELNILYPDLITTQEGC